MITVYVALITLALYIKEQFLLFENHNACSELPGDLGIMPMAELCAQSFYSDIQLGSIDFYWCLILAYITLRLCRAVIRPCA